MSECSSELKVYNTLLFIFKLQFQVEYYVVGSPVTRDLRPGRVRIFYDPKTRIIVDVPKEG